MPTDPPRPPTLPEGVFVYGTLMRGGVRQRHWPHPPRRVLPATLRGELRDLGPYPALVTGEDLVGGELWVIAAEHLLHTLEVLDFVESYAGGSDDLYQRRQVQCLVQGRPRHAFAYFYADEDAARQHPRLPADAEGICRWQHKPT